MSSRRELYTNAFRGGLILVVRRDNDGSIDSWIIAKLLHRTWASWKFADSPNEFNMQQTFRGHLVVLIDERTHSDCSAGSCDQACQLSNKLVTCRLARPLIAQRPRRVARR